MCGHCELLVDGDARSIAQIREAVRLLGAQGWQVQTSIFAVTGGVSDQGVEACGSVDPTKATINSNAYSPILQCSVYI